ncbi:MAG: trypsin-like serine protease [Thermoanaerobaculia bacterium]|nr:trypsin-like serine protease [Thermoanaerobaculia bacterium]
MWGPHLASGTKRHRSHFPSGLGPVLSAWLLWLGVTCSSVWAEEDPVGQSLRPVSLKIVNGETTAAFESTVALLDATNGRSFCSGVLIGCATVLTAAHCLCDGTGNQCGDDGPGLLTSPDQIQVFAQHGGLFGVESFDIHPGFAFGFSADVAVLHLDRDAAGVRPSSINTEFDPAPMTPGLITGFGLTDGTAPVADSGLKRTGSVILEECSVVPNGTHLCWSFEEPVGPPGDDSNTCRGDSGGPLFLEVDGELVVAGVTSGGISASCQAPDQSFDTNVFAVHEWIVQQGGSDLDRTVCGPLPPAGSSDTLVVHAESTLGPDNLRDDWSLEVPPDVQLLRVAVNGVDPADNDFDLAVRFDEAPDGANDACTSERLSTFETCDVVGPEPGEWNFAVERRTGEGDYQIVVTRFAATEGQGCIPTSDHLCLGEGSRFKVSARWRDFEDETGTGKAVDISRRDSGLFYFFGPDNLEVLIKILNGCTLNDRFWVFSAATTNVEFTLTVEDTVSGQFWEFENPLGERAPAVTDTDAFATCP